ncbi:extracellular solute-binding protein [Tropicimonas isoalkanivorans]|uniref:Spermidine/putrescine transport system substrate-binding protein n=1 Tax=Tropicimonas isoalkanivorans TaxID=441112 RepID=A0A1I1HJ18_9RHOB|nr:extracellular solute-binding protein [Tropicimonas isoalkanivorans]SFC23974.1 spermidine/putrescine transport system substrate-binding protein [Tropicimonas isoalkanivorans]
MKLQTTAACSAVALSFCVAVAPATADTLRLLTWGGYAPDDVIAQFEEETGHTVEVTTSNNEEMIAKLRATGGGGFDLAQPSQDRIAGPQEEFGIYKPIDMSQIDTALFIPSMLEATKGNTTVGGDVYGVPHIWGTSGLVVDTANAPSVKDYTDLCNDDVAGKVSYRLKRPTLIGFAFAMGMDPFAAYSDEAAYTEMMEKVEAKLIECKANVKTYWDGSDQLIGLMRSGEAVAAMAWDAGGWKLNADNPDINFIAPTSGALGWIDTFALPAKGKADEAAYAWINFVMKPEIAAKITESSSYFTASKGADELVNEEQKARFQASFPPEAIDNIKWYPTVPTGLEVIEGGVLDRVKAAN